MQRESECVSSAEFFQHLSFTEPDMQTHCVHFLKCFNNKNECICTVHVDKNKENSPINPTSLTG